MFLSNILIGRLKFDKNLLSTGRSFRQADDVDGLDEGAAAGHGQRPTQVFVRADAAARLHGEPSGKFKRFELTRVGNNLDN